MSRLGTLRRTTSTIQDHGIANSASSATPSQDTATSVLVRSQEIIEQPFHDRHIDDSNTMARGWTGDVVADAGYERVESATGTRNARLPAEVLEFPKFEALRPRAQAFLVLAEWEGVVLHADQVTIIAQLVPVSGTQQATQIQAEIPMDEVAASDVELVSPGALFRLAVGYETSGGTRTHLSRVVFRRLPAWNKRALDEADVIADEFFNGIRVE